MVYGWQRRTNGWDQIAVGCVGIVRRQKGGGEGVGTIEERRSGGGSHGRQC